ncbi:PREDICTED: uncharacterized protein LOC105564842 [Vollenhovia emeryi]|uniref:uncharacterized protein LOC105564842 n=1 Tax=Vollenhovia emeryi TaxID=411798 RepID=UPI0005F36487|nr:PREDICTED: uncharacterized protein LOC105564842 [Vollenhovia emeryi]
MNIMKNYNIQHKRVSENVILPSIQPDNILPLENEIQLLHNLQPCYQQPVTNSNPPVEELHCIQELGNTGPIAPLQITPSHEIRLENSSLPRERNEIKQVLEVLGDLERKIQITNE